MNHRLLAASTLFLLAMAAAGPAFGSDLERRLESRWRGAWVVTAVDTYSDCSGTHTNNDVSGTLVNSRGRFRFRPGEQPRSRMVRFRSLGCYPYSAAISSEAASIAEIVEEMRDTRVSERAGRLIDQDQEASMEKKKREGYF